MAAFVPFLLVILGGAIFSVGEHAGLTGRPLLALTAGACGFSLVWIALAAMLLGLAR
ncbi:hypothetical protein HD597_010055 [Nonomuraea thailandensis]|uniref:Uncharacterized protein n=1 Tax=Nonomuraea thailandensis TaxID=1188745 RepID=A0A9X2GSB4_9ACTN|nr:hypothetical protein [Nonomuraea thailandensis]MCP2363035.1 hypothetical protein [Nonomuraea thailandensis]